MKNIFKSFIQREGDAHFFPTLFFMTTLVLTGCSDPEEDQAQNTQMVGTWQNVNVQSDYVMGISKSTDACAGLTVENNGTEDYIDLDVRKIDAEGNVTILNFITANKIDPGYFAAGQVDRFGLLTYNTEAMSKVSTKLTNTGLTDSGTALVSVLPSGHLHFQNHLSITDTQNEFLKTHSPVAVMEAVKVTDIDLQYFIDAASTCLIQKKHTP